MGGPDGRNYKMIQVLGVPYFRGSNETFATFY